jgi:glycosyltransferase involved in cell wall biosynthesis
MRIVHVITTLDVGGAEMHLLSQVRGQAQRGHVVRVVYLKGKGTLAQDFRDAGASWVGPVGSGPALPVRLAPHVRQADIVHSHLLKADMATAVVATLCGRRARLVASKHNDEQVLLRAPVSFVHGLLGNLPARTIVLSDHVGKFIEEHGRVKRSRLRRIYYGLDPAPFEEAAAAPRAKLAELRASFGFRPGDSVFVCVARFAPQKAHDVLLESFAQVLERAPNARLLLVGDDPFGDGRRKAEAIARELGLDGRAVFAGIRRDVPALMAMSDVFVMCSLWEGLGLVFLEAMATGLPVLATRVSAVPEVVIEGETGLLVAPSDVDDLARAMHRLANDAELRARLGAGGKKRVRSEFDLERMIEETLKVYRDVLEGAGALPA